MRLLGLAVLLVALGCVGPSGGWDASDVASRVPAINRFSGHRLGDLIPFPALSPVSDGEGVKLVACRFAGEGPVWVEAEGFVAREGLPRPDFVAPDGSAGPGASPGSEPSPSRARAELIEVAVRETGRMIPGLDLRLGGRVGAGAPLQGVEGPPGAIRVRARPPGQQRRGAALGETQSECDVSPTETEGILGEITRAEIEIGALVLGSEARPRAASDAEWLGALMHELGHGVGFVGHVALGDSLMVRERSTLRRWGARVLSGRGAERELTLAALYALPPGEVLGRRALHAEARQTFSRLKALHALRATQGGVLDRVVSMAGDRDARIEWRYSNGVRAGMWFRGWAQALRDGDSIQLELDLATQRDLLAAGL
ncbi:MAG: hypothetical protein AB8G23_08580 [Myxococcota bacterium]